jgi:hypothetical protein
MYLETIFNSRDYLGNITLVSMGWFSGLDLITLIPDDVIQNGIIAKATKEMADCHTYGCGCFWFGMSTGCSQ